MQVTYEWNKHAKKHVWLSIETYFGFYEIFYISNIKQKYSYTIMYDCEKSPLKHELSYIWLLDFSHFKFVSCKWYL
jgi:hypothetical protein